MRKLYLSLSLFFFFFTNAIAQEHIITGKVTDDKNNPLPNVSVIVKGTTTGATTATDGTYSISVPANGKTLEFSSLNFETVLINIGSKTSISLSLNAAGAKELEEVVVTGINRIKKSQFTGAATKIDESQLKNQPVGSFDQILQGRVPGLASLTSSGAPGTSSTIIIRGQGSIEGGTDPLYIVDGIPVEAGVFQGLNPNDFASVDVLRDASSTALYGSRGSSGVIVVTTKRGSSGKIKFGYSAQFGVKTKPDFAFRPMNTSELLRAQHDYGKIVGGAANTNSNIPGWFYSADNPRVTALSADSQAMAGRLYDSISKINTNWSDQIFRNANFGNHQITLSGVTGKTRLYSSLDIYNEEGITVRTDMKRVTLHNNLDYADDKFNYGLSVNLAYTKRDFQESTIENSLDNPFLTSSISAPYSLIKNPNGTYATGSANSFSAVNQLQLTSVDKNYNNQFKGTVGLTTGYKITNMISASLTSGVDFRETQNSNYGSKLAFVRQQSGTIDVNGFQTEGLDRFLTADVRPSVTYKNRLNEKNDLEVSVFGEYVTELSKNFNATGYGSDPKRPNTIAAIPAGSQANQLFHEVTGFKSKDVLLSGLLIARYTYKNKYTLSGSYRQDGSSKLPKNTRWQDFFSIGGIWEASKENFIENIHAINSLRVKLSYGSSGNSNNFPGGSYPYQVQYGGGTYGAENTILPNYPGNNNLKWETTYTTNLGVDFELLNRRLYGDVNLYSKITNDLFIAKELSATAGFGNGFVQNINAGRLSNKGIELNLNAEVIRKKNITWTIFGNFGYNKNRVKNLGGQRSYETGTEFIKTGLPLGSHYIVKWGGVDAATGEPLYYNKEGQLVTSVDDSDRVQTFGTWEAPWKGGFGTNVRFKEFDLSVLFSWQAGSTKLDNMEYFTENPAGFLPGGYNQSSDLHFWQKPGDIANTPSPQYGTTFSSKLIHNSSFLRLRDARLGYNIPKKLFDKIKYVSGASLYVQGSNLFIWTKWRGRDPEAGSTNINLSEFPNPRTYTAGFEINF